LIDPSILKMSPQFLVLYYFQGEPGESIDSPNAFSVSFTHREFLMSFP
jgi:hypothetical protein